MSSLLDSNLVNYIRTRYPPWLIVPLSLLIASAALASRPTFSFAQALAVFIQAVPLICEFRLWDDLADRSQDQERHPNRILCQTNRLSPFYFLLIVMLTVNFAFVFLAPCQIATLILFALHILLALWYGTRERLRLGPVVNYHFTLLKYPLFVIILGNQSDSFRKKREILAAIVVYIALCLYEVLHDPLLRRHPSAKFVIILESCLLVIVLFAVVCNQQ